MKVFASDLAKAIGAGAISVQLRAYAGDAWDTSPDACRLSMDRALSIRQLLISGRLREDQINILAMGGITDEEYPDRVDIYVQTK